MIEKKGEERHEKGITTRENNGLIGKLTRPNKESSTRKGRRTKATGKS